MPASLPSRGNSLIKKGDGGVDTKNIAAEWSDEHRSPGGTEEPQAQRAAHGDPRPPAGAETLRRGSRNKAAMSPCRHEGNGALILRKPC